MHGFVDRVEVDLIVNGQPEGPMATDIASGRYSVEPQVGFDAGLLRPVIMPDGKRYCSVASGRMVRNKQGAEVAERRHIPLQRLINNGVAPFAYNASALPYETWQRIDRAVIRASRDRLNAWNDLAAANTYGGFNGMAITGLIRDTMTDPGDATVDMDTLSDDLNDAPLYTPDIVPLPIIHAGAKISQRRLAQSRNGGIPLDTTMLEVAGRRCAETLEKMTIGVTDFSDVTIGASNIPAFTRAGIYGFRTQPDRITKTDITAPGWTEGTSAQLLVTEIIEMIESARAQKFYGPFVLYYSTSWDQYMDRDYFTLTTSGAASPAITVFDRINRIKSIQRVAMLDMFTNTDELLLVQMTAETVRAIDGMDWTPVQWSVDGGAESRLRVIGIKVPDLRAQFVGNSTSSRKCGIVHGTTS